MNIKILFSFLLIFTSAVNGYKVLLLLPFTSKSVHLLFSSLSLALSKSGHNVTLFTSFDQSEAHPNLEHFQPKDYMKVIALDNLFEVRSMISFYKVLSDIWAELPQLIWSTQEVWDLYHKRNEYDAIITPSIGNEAILPFFDGFNGYHVIFCTPGVEYNCLSYNGNWATPAIIPQIHSPYDEYMTFSERVGNSISFATEILLQKFVVDPKVSKAVRVYFPNYTNNRDYYTKNHLTLINGHFSLDSPVPLLPSEIEIGTINARHPNPLPEDLEAIFDKADAGVIYFSLGSFAPAKSIPKKYKEIFLQTFAQVPFTVIWKYEDNDLELPSNVITRKWLPQEDILGHPKTKIFISHCGNLGTQEAKFHGVPILAIPIAYDQARNAARLDRKGYGVTVNWNDMSVNNLLDAIHTLTNDTSYYDLLKNVSKIVKDQKDSPAERAVWWIEYVIRHKGAPHLRYAGQRLSFLQYIMVDVIVFWLLVVSTITVVFLLICKSIWRKLFATKKKQVFNVFHMFLCQIYLFLKF